MLAAIDRKELAAPFFVYGGVFPYEPESCISTGIHGKVDGW